MKTKLKIVSVVIAVLIASCSNNNSNVLNEKEIEQYLNKQEAAYELICKEAGKEVWEYYSDTSRKSMSEYKTKFSSFLLNDSLISKISDWNVRIKEIKNDTLARRVKLWNNILTCAQVDFDPEIIQLQNELESQLANYPSDDIADDEIEKSVKKLIDLRNDKAKQMGYGNYAYMLLQHTGIDTVWFENLIHTIDSASSEPYKRFVNDHISGNDTLVEYDQLRKYIIQAYLIRETPEIENNEKEALLYKTLADIGLDVSDFPIHFEIADLPPGIGGFGNCLDIPNDFRAVVKKDLCFYYVLHEIGHGLQGTNVAVGSAVLKGYEWCTGNQSDLYSEAMAETIARFAQNKYWLEKNGFNERALDSLDDARKSLYPVYLRLKLINTMFEIELYKHPEKDPASIKRELYLRYFLTDKDFSHRPNLITLPYVSYPVYEQNYLIADIISWQIHDYLEKSYGDQYAFDPGVGQYLIRELWNNGELKDWQNRILTSTGKTLDVGGYLDDLLK